MNLTIDQFLSLTRGLLNLGGGALVATGVMSGGTMATVSGIVLNVAGLAWGTFVHSDQQTVKAAQVVEYKNTGLPMK
jgi:hypothetical protein